MHVISRKKLLEAAREHGELGGPLDVWYRIAKKAHWKNLMDVRQMLPTADPVDKFTVLINEMERDNIGVGGKLLSDIMK